MKKIFIITLFSMLSSLCATDLIIFSYNRPLQLFALLESIEFHVQGLTNIYVIMRADNQRYFNAYKHVAERFNNVIFSVQNLTQGNDFKVRVMEVLKKTSSEYVMFAVDDIIVVDAIDCAVCEEVLASDNSILGFYLRLGKNITCSYPFNQSRMPQFLQSPDEHVLKWQFSSAGGDWAYPHTVDLAIYRKSMVISDFNKIIFQAPNSLEGNWHGTFTTSRMSMKGAAFLQSCMINIPLNQVQKEGFVPNMNAYTAEALLRVFEEGKKINISLLRAGQNKAPHMDYWPEFIEREHV